MAPELANLRLPGRIPPLNSPSPDSGTVSFFHFSELWQLVINTGTTIVTFLMVFLIQNAQNRESKAVHLKLDELILAVRGAKNELIDIESLTEQQLEQLADRYRRFAESYHRNLETTLEGMERGMSHIRETVGEVGASMRRVEREITDVRGEADTGTERSRQN